MQPDVFVAPPVDGRRPRSWKEISRLLLAVEILSPSSARADRGVKRRLYLRQGAEYWVVDLEARLVERWLPGDERPEVLTQTRPWPRGASASLEIELPAFFAAVWGETPSA